MCSCSCLDRPIVGRLQYQIDGITWALFRPHSRARKEVGSSHPPPVSDLVTEGRVAAPLERGLRLQPHGAKGHCACSCMQLQVHAPRLLRVPAEGLASATPS